MTREELSQLIADVQRRQSELEDMEVKSAQGGTPERLYEALSAFANRPGGGVILCGLDEAQDFRVTGVFNAQRLQEEISHLASSEMEPALRPVFTVERMDDKMVVAVEVAAVPVDRKPCYYRPAGLQGGSYIRVGNTNRRMSDYEIFGYTSSRAQPRFDEDPVQEATLADLDKTKMDAYLRQLRKMKPDAAYLKQSQSRGLKQLRVVKDASGQFHPTLAGLLMFGHHPQAFEPQLVITFVQYYGTTEAEKTPRGERFLDNRKFEGTVPEMIEGAVNHILATIRKSSLIEGLWRRDIPEYPEEAIREAIVNAVAHRDYSPFARGSYVQVRLFADRLEIQSPGGLYGNVTEESLEEEQSTRNRILMRLMEDARLVENRGSGIQAMLAAMRGANLEPPRFQDKRSSFWVIFHNHTLMSPEAVAWLNRFASRALNDHQRLALVYLRHHNHLTSGEYQRLNHVDALVAGRELRGLTRAGLTEQHRSRRWAYYTLSVPVEVEKPGPSGEDARILGYVREHGSISNEECRILLSVTRNRAWYLLRRIAASGKLRRQGERKLARYVAP